MEVGLLKIEEKETIQGKEYAPDCFFNPIQDNNDNWVISTEEMDQLPLIDYEPKPSPSPFEL